jgi:DNA polymerase elongation subunit (family B)
MEQINFFPYSWYIDENNYKNTPIRIYAIGDENENICIKINNFNPYVYIELPNDLGIRWTDSSIKIIVTKIKSMLSKNNSIKEYKLKLKRKLYYAHLDKNKKPKLFPYIYMSFGSLKDIRTLSFALQKTINTDEFGLINLKMHEHNASAVLQLCCVQNIPTSGWIKAEGIRTNDEEKITLCEKEYDVEYKNLFPILDRNYLAKPKIMGFDIEVNSSNVSAMPKAENIEDKIFQISCIFSREGDKEEDYKKYILTLKGKDGCMPIQELTGDDVIIWGYDTEGDMLIDFANLICEENPNVIVGYNIMGFDIPYMIDRAKNPDIDVFDAYSMQGLHKENGGKEKTISWSSSAFKNNNFQFLDVEGRLFVDLMQIIKKDYKLDNYKLKTVSDFFLKDNKDDLPPKGIFQCYRLGMKGGLKGSEALAKCGKYCIKDSVLVVKLMDKLNTWNGLIEMANVCNVTPYILCMQGQQVKVFSQVYKYCFINDIVVEKDVYETKENDRYMGAYVFEPVPGCYDRVVPFDQMV